MTTKRTGAYGERIAAQYLLQKGYTVAAMNWHCRQGELDIVAQDGDVLVFVEVKSRRAADTSDTFLSLTPQKRRRLIASAYSYIDTMQLTNPVWRIDVIGIALPTSGQPVIEHVEDALDW